MKLLSRLGAALARLRVAQQLFAAFFAVLALAAVMGATAIVGLHRVDAQAVALNDKWLQGVGHLAAMRAAVVESRDFEIKHSRATDRSYHAEYEEKLGVAAKSAASALTAYGTQGPWAGRRGFDSLVQTAMGFIPSSEDLLLFVFGER